MVSRASLTPQQEAELAFWHGLVQQVGPEYFYAYRCAEYYEKTKHFPGWLQQKGTGLDVGCGCISVFEAAGLQHKIFATDPLVNHYALLFYETASPRRHVSYRAEQQGSRLPFTDKYFDWVACLNMIDHTPEPVWTLNEIHRVLRPNGKLYFEVNFEAGIAPPHYCVWNGQTVAQHLTADKWQCLSAIIEPVPQHNQSRYWGEYKKI